jgi:hypothetical protein
MIISADKALYSAKNAGRNTIANFDDIAIEQATQKQAAS